MPINVPTTPSTSLFTIQPENFRRVIQRQIEQHVANEINGLTLFVPDTNDGRYAGNKPVPTVQMSNGDGYQYFIVGRSIVGGNQVAAP